MQALDMHAVEVRIAPRAPLAGARPAFACGD
jgi:hypothetical protein